MPPTGRRTPAAGSGFGNLRFAGRAAYQRSFTCVTPQGISALPVRETALFSLYGKPPCHESPRMVPNFTPCLFIYQQPRSRRRARACALDIGG